MRLKLKAAIKEEPELQELMPTLANAFESHTKKMDTTTTKLTLEIFFNDCGINSYCNINLFGSKQFC